MLELSYLLYASSSILLATIIFLMPTVAADPLEASYLRRLKIAFTWLAMYALLNSVLQMIELVELLDGGHPFSLWPSSFLLFFSAVCLVYAARGISIRWVTLRWRKRAVFWQSVGISALLSILTALATDDFRLGWENGIRLWMILPASLILALSMFIQVRSSPIAAIGQLGFAFAMLIYGVCAGMVLKPIAGLPFWLPNYDEFQAWTGVPVQFLRSLSVLAICLSLITLIRVSSRSVAKELSDSSKYLERLFDSVVDGLVVIDQRGVIRSFNSSAERLLGWTRREVIGQKVNLLMPEPHRSDHDDYLERYLMTGERHLMVAEGRDVQAVHKDGREVYFNLAVNEWTTPEGELAFVGTLRDISARKKAEHRLHLAWAMLEQVDDAVCITDMSGKTICANTALCDLFGISQEVAMSSTLPQLAMGRMDASSLGLVLGAIADDEPKETEVWMSDGGTEGLPWLLTTRVITVEQERFRIATLKCIQAIKMSDERAFYLSSHDALTGLLNRVAFSDRLEYVLKISRREQRAFALMYIDLDGFKAVNDRCGHDVGDQLLCQVGERMKGCLRQTDTIARLGGDEFAVIIEHVLFDVFPTFLAEEIIWHLSQPFGIEGESIRVGASVGIAISDPADMANSSELVRLADQAMYRSKKAGKGIYTLLHQAKVSEASDEQPGA